MKIIRKILTLALATGLSVAALSITAAASETMYGIGFVNTSSLRLRSSPDINSATIAQAPQGDCVAVINKTGSWYKVNYNLSEGYMHESYLRVLPQENAELGYGVVTATNVNLRSGPATSYSSVAKASTGAQCYILGLNNGWYKVLYESKTCYIRSDFLALTEIPYENQASPNTPQYYRGGNSIAALPNSSVAVDSSTSSIGVSGPEILAEAQKYLGTPYVNGGASPNGFDCSGFVYYVLKQCGYTPYRTPNDQYKQGSSVDKSNLKPGDIVFFSNTYTSGISHVGIYAGDGQFIHSPNSRSTVSYSDLTGGYWADHYYGARRMG